MSLDMKKQEEDITLQKVLYLIDECIVDIKKGYQEFHFQPAMSPARSLREVAAMRINVLLKQVEWREGDEIDMETKRMMRGFECANLAHEIKVDGRADPLGVFDEMAEAIVRLQDVAAIKSKTPQEEQDRDAYVRIQIETIKMCGPPLQAMFPDKADYDRRLIAAQKRFRKKMELEELRKKDD